MIRTPLRVPDPALLARLPGLFRQREWMMKIKIILLLMVGVPALFIGPALLAVIYSVAFFWLYYLPLTWTFWGFVVVLIPLLFWTEWRHRGSLLSDAVSSEARESETPMVFGMGEMGMLLNFTMNPRRSAAGFVELFLWGPRQILDAVEKLRQVSQLRHVDRGRAADAVATLARWERGIEVKDLASKSENSGTLLGALSYLLVYDWIGISKNGDRVWMNSDARRKLA